MYTLVFIIHILACLFLILLVLLQSGKGSVAGIFGNSNSDSIFAAPSSATTITKLTAIIAAVIMITSIILTINVAKRGESSVIDNVKIPVSQTK